jgi:Tfp pilus assembly protein PilF
MANKSRLLFTAILGAALAPSLPAQSVGGGSRPPINPGAGGRGANPPSTSQRSTALPTESRRLLYITGLVMLDDGSPPPDAVTIEISCGGRPRPYGVTDSRGAFSVNFGQPDPSALADSGYSGQLPRSSGGNGGGKLGSATALMGCELNVRLPGFRSDPIQLGARSQLDHTSLGSIILHRLASVRGYTFSMTTMNAPTGARKDYEKGIVDARKARWPEAEAHFRKAVAAYPKYAVCWEALGRTLEVQKRVPDAQRAYEQSIQADPRFVTPHLRLMMVLSRNHRWEAVAKCATTVVQLDPYSYPIAYYFSGIANLNLKREEIAERDVRAGLNADPHGTVPRLNHLMGTLLMERKAYAEALPYLKAYLQDQPTSNDAEAVKGAITYAERMAGVPGPDAPQR